MPAKLDQNAVEAKLSEVGLFVVKWPSGKYVNIGEIVDLGCADGHIFSTSVRNVIYKNKGCTRCRGAFTRTSSEWEREVELKGFIFHGWLSLERGVKGRIEVTCKNGHRIETAVGNITNGRGFSCHKCGRYSAAKTRSKSHVDNVSAALNKGLKVLEFIGGCASRTARVRVICQKCGNTFDDTVKAIVGRKNGCVKCSPVYIKTPNERVAEIEAAGNIFIKWDAREGNVSSKARAVVMCQKGHVRTATVDRLVHGKTGCPSCIKFGYNPDRPGVLYALLSDDGAFVKIGITNNLNRRLKELRRATPFGFNLIGVIKGDGRHICLLEKLAHSGFARAGLEGFDGSTEWFEWCDDVHRWLLDHA